MQRLAVVGGHLKKPNNEVLHEQSSDAKEAIDFLPEQTLTITDNRHGGKRNIVVPVSSNTVRASDFKKLSTPSSPGILIYDPAYTNTSCCISRISFIEGDKGILRYRGFPIEQLAGRVGFEEVAFLLIYGELPTAKQSATFSRSLMHFSSIPDGLIRMIQTFRSDAHPMGVLMSAVAALGTYFPDSNPCLQGQDVYKDLGQRNKQVIRLLGCIGTIAATIDRHLRGLGPPVPQEHMGFTENFLHMVDQQGCNDRSPYRPHIRFVKALDILFVLHAEHELNCSTAATRHLSSANADVCSCIAGAIGALYGPRHGGANEAVVKMLEKIGRVEHVASFIDRVKSRQEKLMGFGHRVYKNYDPRAKLVRKVAEEVFEIIGHEPLIEVAMELERVALSDEYFIKRKLYPNVDFYSGLIYKAMGFDPAFFPLLFAVPRCAGWLAHWYEFQDDSANRIVRPFQIYTGPGLRDVPQLDSRPDNLLSEQQLAFTLLATERRKSVSLEV